MIPRVVHRSINKLCTTVSTDGKDALMAPYRDGDPPPDCPVRDRDGLLWTPGTRPVDQFQGWSHRPAAGLQAHWMTWDQLAVQRGPLADDDPVAVLCDRLQAAMAALVKMDGPYWGKLEELLYVLLDDDGNPVTDPTAVTACRIVLGEETPA
jgi:hypothetical protein